MQHKKLQLTVFVLILAVFMSAVNAAVPPTINYQGRLLDNAGDPVADGPYEIKFKIYGSPTGADSLWSSGFQSVTVTDGLFDYQLGSAVSLHAGHFTTPDRYLGITVGTDTEITPRVQLVSVPWAYRSQWADEAGMADDAQSLAGEDPDFYLNWGDMTNVPAGFADGIDNEGSGDITGVTAGSGLSGGGTSGDVSVYVPTNGITASHIATGAVGTSEIADESITTADIQNGSVYNADIANNTITDIDISNSAAIATTKISGTAVNLSSAQTITGSKTFDGDVYFGDSTLIVYNDVIALGTAWYSSSVLAQLRRTYDITTNGYGIYSSISSQNTGTLYSIVSTCERSETEGGNVYGLYSTAKTSLGSRYGLYAKAEPHYSSVTTGLSYGVRAEAKDGSYAYGIAAFGSSAETNYAVFASTYSSIADWAGYFYGNLHATGTNTKGSGGFKIDHPLDPENMYLTHSDVESPDMMNIYNGNVILDANGGAEVALPDYFDALNADFRYQLTCMGNFAPVYVSEKIKDNNFRIAGGKPFMEVSWQVTGIRKDAFANAARKSTEQIKPDDEKGQYMHPEIFGYGIEQAVDYIHHKTDSDDEYLID